MQSETQVKTTEELIHGYEVLRKTLTETANQLQKEKRSKTIWRFFAVLIICIFVYAKKSNAVWLPVADSQQMCVLMSDWWGLKVQAYYPVWRQPTGETGEYSEQWCIKYPDNSWRGFYGRHGKSSTYTSPPITTYNTYF